MKYSISIISHQSGLHLTNLLKDLNNTLPEESEIILTINTAEDETYLSQAKNLPITVIRNSELFGFGENHNRAFKHAKGKFFIIINPDIRINRTPFDSLSKTFTHEIGACAPVVLSPKGDIEDSARRFPTAISLFNRFIFKRKNRIDYPLRNSNSQEVDWTAGMFIMFDSAAFRCVDGFDSRYFMYMEDVDICRRLKLKGYKIIITPDAQVIHDAQRASSKNWQHFKWHMRSAIRFLFSTPK